MKCNETGVNPSGKSVGGSVWWLGTADHSGKRALVPIHLVTSFKVNIPVAIKINNWAV